MNRRFILASLIVLSAAGGFALTYAARGPAAPTRPATNPSATELVLDWLEVPAEKRPAILAHDPAFAEDLARLRGDLQQRRQELAQALESPATPDAELRSRSEAIIAASGLLERRVTDHLLSIRQYLSADQQKRLFGLCAEGVRQGRGWRWRQQDGAGPGSGQGRGPGPHGRGMGFGPASRPTP